MANVKTVLRLLSLWGACASLAAAAHTGGNGVTEASSPAGNDIAVEPASPSAYQAFDLRFLTGSGGLRHQSVSIEIIDHRFDAGQDSQVVVEYLAREDAAPGGASALGTEIQGLPAGEYQVLIRERRTDDQGRTDSLHEIDTLDFTILPEFVNTSVHAMYHPALDRYFLTPIESEWHARGDRGWQRRGGFAAWPAEGPAPEEADPVCRFHNRESRSHFYTADQAECERLRSTESGWRYLGLAFRALTPEAGVCPRGTSPVWRLYNGRHAQGEANHAYVRQKATYRTLMHDGWEGEGIAFCGAPRTYRESDIEQAHNPDTNWP